MARRGCHKLRIEENLDWSGSLIAGSSTNLSPAALPETSMNAWSRIAPECSSNSGSPNARGPLSSSLSSHMLTSPPRHSGSEKNMASRERCSGGCTVDHQRNCSGSMRIQECSTTRLSSPSSGIRSTGRFRRGGTSGQTFRSVRLRGAFLGFENRTTGPTFCRPPQPCFHFERSSGWILLGDSRTFRQISIRSAIESGSKEGSCCMPIARSGVNTRSITIDNRERVSNGSIAMTSGCSSINTRTERGWSQICGVGRGGVFSNRCRSVPWYNSAAWKKQ
jgi:hypothetical protein